MNVRESGQEMFFSHIEAATQTQYNISEQGKENPNINFM